MSEVSGMPGPLLPLTLPWSHPAAVARALLGHQLVCLSTGLWRGGRIVETEAYLGPQDLAAHASKGRTARTEPLFGPPGRAYVYFVYGIHWMMNVSCGGGGGVLIRALDAPGASGPGRLTRALGITGEHSGHPLDQPPLVLVQGQAVARISTGPRIGVAYAGPVWSKRRLRFWATGHPAVSRAR